MFFSETQVKPYYIAKEFAKSADVFHVVKGNLDDDTTMNFVVKFKPDRIDDIAFMQYCFSKGVSCGYALYGLPVTQYWLALECDWVSGISPSVPQKVFAYYVSDEEKQHYKKILKYLYAAYGEEVDH